jgi:hypothetical protein
MHCWDIPTVFSIMSQRQPPSESVLRQLILYVVAKLNEAGRRPSTIQLVKFLYLIDIEHQRALRRTLTGFRWVYYHFGPYAFELPRLMSGIGYQLDVETFTSNGHEGRALEVNHDVPFPSGMGAAAQSIVDRIIKIWASVETKDILDHVYFETEPMIDAQRGDELDFGTVQPSSGGYDLVVNETKQLRALRKRHEKPLPLSGRVPANINPPVDALFVETMISLDKEDRA